QPREPGPLRIGYFSGTTTHDADWALVAPVVADLVRRRGDVELWLGGPVTLGPDFDGLDHAVHRLPMMDWTRLPARLRQMDVNLAPLVPDSVFNEAKSAIKWLEAALVATPTVASPTEPFREAIDDGVTGILAGPQDWGPALERLLDDPAARARTGTRARRAALLGWAPAAQGHAYRAILRDALERRLTAPARPSSWVPVADDEPYDAAAAWVDPYPPSGLGGDVPVWRRRLSPARRVYSDRGARGLASAVRQRLG
ncbi:MAG: glycosyltransferase, partial [Cellulomonas sp.]|nr:glycosyltransferase [Cellulomonas sp.]